MGDPREVNRQLWEEWMHSVSEIIMALISAGLTLEDFLEFPVTGYQCLPFLVDIGGDTWRTPDGYPDLPLTFTMRFRR